MITLSSDTFNELSRKLDEIMSALTEQKKMNTDEFIDNADFIQLMKISKRTAQAWRDEGKISFSQIGGKIYYKMSDVHEMVNRYKKNI